MTATLLLCTSGPGVISFPNTQTGTWDAMNEQERRGDRESEVLDVELLDVLAEIEALLRQGREVQREALRVRGVPHPVTSAQRQTAGGEIQRRVRDMRKECHALDEVLQDLETAANTLAQVLNGETQREAAIGGTRAEDRSLAADHSERAKTKLEPRQRDRTER